MTDHSLTVLQMIELAVEATLMEHPYYSAGFAKKFRPHLDQFFPGIGYETAVKVSEEIILFPTGNSGGIGLSLLALSGTLYDHLFGLAVHKGPEHVNDTLSPPAYLAEEQVVTSLQYGNSPGFTVEMKDGKAQFTPIVKEQPVKWGTGVGAYGLTADKMEAMVAALPPQNNPAMPVVYVYAPNLPKMINNIEFTETTLNPKALLNAVYMQNQIDALQADVQKLKTVNEYLLTEIEQLKKKPRPKKSKIWGVDLDSGDKTIVWKTTDVEQALVDYDAIEKKIMSQYHGGGHQVSPMILEKATKQMMGDIIDTELVKPFIKKFGNAIVGKSAHATATEKVQLTKVLSIEVPLETPKKAPVFIKVSDLVAKAKPQINLPGKNKPDHWVGKKHGKKK